MKEEISYLPDAYSLLFIAKIPLETYVHAFIILITEKLKVSFKRLMVNIFAEHNMFERLGQCLDNSSDYIV